MIKIGLIGYPLKHSYSKNIFKKRKDIEYKNYEIKNLNNIRNFIFKNRISGLNVTAPYKEEIIKYVDELEDKTNKVKSVNTLKVCFESNKIKGFNTDIYGFELSLKRFIKNKKIKAILFGDGGVAKTIKYVLEKEKIEYIQVSRKNKKNIKYCELEKKHFENQNVILSDNAVWKTNEKRNFYFKRAFDRLNGGATLLSEKTNITDLSLNKEVQCIDISEVIRVIGSDIDVLKMDVEGAEYQILDRLFKTGLYKKVKSIYFEDHSRKFVDKAWHSRKERVLELYKSANIELNWW